ncbi:MAG: dienelactone hydrolase family protein [Ignavibacteriaceae bacterium]|nr:dienelactone hydrolase family protein [Ignavibacteriaceae bacterium]
MKYFALIFLFFAVLVSAQSTESCCPAEEDSCSEDKMAKFAGDENFVEAHKNPLSADYTDFKGSMVPLKVNNSFTAQMYLVPSATPSNKYLFVIHEWWGLNDHIKKETDNFALHLEGVNLIALDLYEGKIASTQQEASTYIKEVNPALATETIVAALNYTGDDGEVAVVGWCFGGGWAIQTAILGESKVKACVFYYGMPENDPAKLSKISAPVLGIIAEKDGWITPQIASDFESKMNELGKSVQILLYDAVHAFANPSNPDYDHNAANDALANSLKFFGKHFHKK